MYTACGMTVAPSIDVANMTVSVPSNLGTMPEATPLHDRGEKASPAVKPMATTTSIPMMTISKVRCP